MLVADMVPLVSIPSPYGLGYASNPVLPEVWNLGYVMDHDPSTTLPLDDVSPWFQIDLGNTYEIYAVRDYSS